MAIRNTCYCGASNWCDGNALSAADLNDTFTATYNTTVSKVNSATDILLENAMNIAKLQYCNSVADISHDYMAVDVFTDATGYNNMVTTVGTDSILRFTRPIVFQN
jgi:hypothetical protein